MKSYLKAALLGVGLFSGDFAAGAEWGHIIGFHQFTDEPFTEVTAVSDAEDALLTIRCTPSYTLFVVTHKKIYSYTPSIHWRVGAEPGGEIRNLDSVDRTMLSKSAASLEKLPGVVELVNAMKKGGRLELALYDSNFKQYASQIDLNAAGDHLAAASRCLSPRSML